MPGYAKAGSKDLGAVGTTSEATMKTKLLHEADGKHLAIVTLTNPTF